MTKEEVPYIIVVDDEEIVRELFRDWLEAAGYVVDVASSAAAARALMEKRLPHVVVTDIRMARETGIDLLAWVRERDPDIPVILVTGVPALETAVEALRRQAYDYLTKPVNDETLRRVIARALEHRRLSLEKRRLEAENLRYQQHLEELVAERTAALERRTRQLLLLHQAAKEIGKLREETALYEHVVRVVQEAFGYTNVAMFEVDLLDGVFRLLANAGAKAQALPRDYSQPIEAGLLGRAYKEGVAIIVNDVSEHPEFIPCPGIEVKAEAILPIRVEGDIVALLNIDEDHTDAFDETDRMVLHTLADYVGMAVANARLFRELQDALRAREEMFNNVSHELRTPLTIIRGYAELLTEGIMGSIDEETREAVQTILEQARHLTKLVDQLVAFRIIEREGISLEPLQFSDWLTYAVGPWQPVFQEAGITLNVDVPSGLGTVMGNADFLQRVINNLLDNARKFSPKGGAVHVTARREGNEVIVTVADEGIGVPPEKLGRIFDRFYQVDGGTTRKFGGMGLGLALVHEIITRHGGRVWAHSEGEGKGLRVIFALPVVND